MARLAQGFGVEDCPGIGVVLAWFESLVGVQDYYDFVGVCVLFWRSRLMQFWNDLIMFFLMLKIGVGLAWVVNGFGGAD